MGQINSIKIILLVFCFALTSVFVYWDTPSKAVQKKIPLSQVVAEIKGWSSGGGINFDPRIVDALELDDYIYQNYSKSNANVSLYIGYYFTSKKVGAAHSPLVCFPGQGWVLSNGEAKFLKIGGHNVKLMSMVARKGEKKELLLYWFQAFDKTSPGTFLQKIHVLWSKFFHHREDNAFVRVSVPMDRQTKREAFGSGVEFIEAFYPRFLQYVKDGQI